ncbi:MAG: hypothetical protein COA66_00725 [Arcobacter sp.]|nr:MAG: hypothetical protein COA66_00725 [Arcobacter sp.]
MISFFPHLSKTLSTEVKKSLKKDYDDADKIALIISFLGFLITSFVTSYSYDTYFLGVTGGGVLLIISFIAYCFYKGSLISRLLFAIIFMIYPAIMLQQQLGMIEMHFGFFCMAAVLMIYKDITPMLMSAFTMLFHHIFLTYLQLNGASFFGETLMIYSVNCSWVITLIHIIMWAMALLMYMFISIKNSHQFIRMLEQSEELDSLNNTLEDKVLKRTQELLEQKNIFETLFNEGSDGYCLSKNSKFIACNSTVLKMLKYKYKEDFLNLRTHELSPKFQENGTDSQIESKKKLQDCIETGSAKFEWLHRKSTGEDFWVEILLTKIIINNEIIIHSSWRDIGEKKRLEHEIQIQHKNLEVTNMKLEASFKNLERTQKKLVEVEKIASLGTLVAGVAHEINTPVGIGITATSHLMELTSKILNKYKKDEISEEEFEEFLKDSASLSSLSNSNLHRTAEIINNFKQVTLDRTNEHKRVFNVCEYIDVILSSIKNKTKKKDINIIINCDRDLKIDSYPGLFGQIITNLIINSYIHGFNNKHTGTITLIISMNNDILNLKYKDNGLGISNKNLKKIFDPFFTTNRENGGSGLGLNIIYNIISQNLKGSINCTSEENNGVQFNILIPSVKYLKKLKLIL